MEVKARIFFLFTVLICSSSYVLGQKADGLDDLLPPPTETLNRCTVLRYVDDAIVRAYRTKSKLFVIVRAKDFRDARLTATRAKNIKNYYSSRGFTFIEVLGDVTADRSNVLDLYLNGDVLYSLPIKKRETLWWAHC